ncbi:hypothetical protein [[Limnothrix rosea] IAM M-220]|uniref:hypothetical protein n=1 Tax=[Limnothrix rosea] IAM M-220 TaxID=454133 RepID=UPI000962A118|nr:hypothetical protein [[Limnothrix rosea] IAM M-220]OKH14590.1 hypothetical protein NIES208_13905 [[Limnothrix rosea] IAM M-220]
MVSEKRRKKASATLEPPLHSERLFLLGGAWVAMVTMGFLGLSALVNPEKRLPLIDPMLEAIAAMKQQEHIFAPAPEDVKADKTPDVWSAVDLGVGYFGEPAEFSADVVSLVAVESDAVVTADGIIESGSVAETIAVAPPTLPPAVDVMPKDNDVPDWVYWAIAVSCISGSSVITLFLYKLTSPTKVQSRPSTRRPVRRRMKTAAVATAPVTKIPVVAVPPITPLKISTPKTVQPPTLKIEPVIDPQPAEQQKHSRADYLATLAKNAQRQRPKSLVEMMDVRRRNHLARFS